MSRLRRYFEPGQICFLTVVTADRRPILVDHADLLERAFRMTRRKRKFRVLGWVIMPDHLHALVEAPDGNFSSIIGGFKLSFSLWYNRRAGTNGPVWQHRFYDHVVRSEEDIRGYLDYMHGNPVRRGLVDSAENWALSSGKRRRISG